MSTSQILRHILAASALLALTAGAAYSDGAPNILFNDAPRPPPMAPMTQAHLEISQRNLQSALNAVSGVDAAPYGGFVEKEKADASKAVADVAEALAYVQAHPEINPLPAGTVQSDDPNVTLTSSDNPGLNPPGMTLSVRNPQLKLSEVVDALNGALTPLVNHMNDLSTRIQAERELANTHGRVSIDLNHTLGDIGGFRAKIIQDIVQMDADAVAAADFAEGRGPVEPTTQAHLEAVQRALHSASLILTARTGPALLPSPDFGPDLPPAIDKVVGKLAKAQADVAEALAYVKVHPEINPLSSGPAPAETSKIGPVTIPGSRAPNNERLTLTANALNAAFGHLLNDPSADYDGPVLGDIGGYREKILDEIGSVTTDVLTQLAAPGPPLRGRSGANPTPPTTGFGIAPAAMIETNTTLNLAAASVDDNPNSNSNVPTAIAGVAMSLAFSLGGLQFLSQRRAVKLPPPR